MKIVTILFVALFVATSIPSYAAEDAAKDLEKGAQDKKEGAASNDPTSNVLALVKAAVQRLDDLRVSENRRIDDMRVLESLRIDQLRIAESRRLDEEAKMQRDFDEVIRLSESKRIDAIRAVDVGNVAVASERAAQQATVLADQVRTSADALRALVATTATAMASSTTELTKRYEDRLSALEKGSYQSTGRASLADPQMEKLLAEMSRMSTASASGAGKSEGISTSYAILIGLVGIGLALYGTLRKPKSA